MITAEGMRKTYHAVVALMAHRLPDRGLTRDALTALRRNR